MILQEGEASSTFNKKVDFHSNLRELNPQNISVSRKDNTSYTFNTAIQLLLGEVITFDTVWTVEGQKAGSYNIIVSAFSNDPDVDPLFRTCQDTCEVQIVADSPIISELVIPSVYYPSFDQQNMYVYPDQNVEVKCNVTCPVNLKNVTLCYSVDSSGIWNQSTMTRNLENEWTGTVPRQSEGKQVILYVEAFSSRDKNSKTKEFAFTVSDLQALDLRTGIVTVATATSILAGCIAIFAIKRRRMIEVL